MSDLTAEEQANVRVALRFLRARFGVWATVAKALRVNRRHVSRMMYGRTVTASVAMRTARLCNVPVDDVLSGRFPDKNVCPHCGQTIVTMEMAA